ncbi:MAG: S1 RNA-binding domain-containing protein [Lachnospiraceae bacterium]|nr:S1 RNA-binding domain-containing protein [Lachnospiraceae bacterium]
MSELTFEQMLDESFKTIRTGEVVSGEVIDVKPDYIILNIGYKSDGILTKSEFTNDTSVDLTEKVKIGDTLEVKVLKVNDGEGQVSLTHKRLAADKGSKVLEDAFNNKSVIKGVVSQIPNNKGVIVVVDEVRVFIPAGLLSDAYEKDLSKFMDKEIEFYMQEYDPKQRRYIGNRKELIVSQKNKAMEEVLSKIKVGDTVEGTVKNVTDFGAFIDLGGIDGLLHIKEMSWGRIESAKKLYKAGDKIKVLIKEINGTRISLSTKFEDENPWKDLAARFPVGSVVTGTVARMTDFGAFVQLEGGVDALLHVSQISKNHIEKPSDVLKIGDEVTAEVTEVNEENNRISLSVRALLQPKKEKTEEAESGDYASVDVDAVVASQEENAE